MLTRIFISKLHDNQVTLAGVTFTISTIVISAATGIPDVGEKWFKQSELEKHYYEPFIKPRYINEKKRYFPFSHLLDRYAPMMTIIMKYFSCEGRFSRLYSYHIWLLMHFTRVKILNIPYYLFQSIDKIEYIFKKIEYEHQMKSIFHHSLIKIIVLYHLNELNIAWSTFIANPIFTDPSIHNVKNVPSSSHPSTCIPPSRPIDHSSSLDQSLSPSPPPSPFHEHIESPSRDEIIELEQIEQVEVIKPKRLYLGTLAHTYQRGHRNVFSPQIVGGGLAFFTNKTGTQRKREDDRDIDSV